MFYPIFILFGSFISLFHERSFYKDIPFYLAIAERVSPFLTVYPPFYNLGILPPVFNVVTGPLT
jgi:hypothetical protein